ncbi:MAG TPA: ester cyclase [Gemmatimonadales bacterium]|nr:ester cyclase [Gemmatimonadales bacterium]
MSAIDGARRYFAAWNARDPGRLAASFRPGGTYEDPNTAGPVGVELLRAYASGLWSAFPDLDFEEVSCRASGSSEVTIVWIMRGTNLGSLRGLPPTGARIALPGVDLVTVRDDGIERVQGFFDRATLMEQLGLMSVVQPRAVGPVRFGVCTQVRSDSPAEPGAVVLTMIEARNDDEVQRIRDVSRRIMLRLPALPGFLSFQGAVVGHRLTTVTVWESTDAARQVMRDANHKEASADMFAAEVGGAFSSSVWTLERMGDLHVRCPGCGHLRDARRSNVCGCGADPGARPAFW